jgi:hypothetical protein
MKVMGDIVRRADHLEELSKYRRAAFNDNQVKIAL